MERRGLGFGAMGSDRSSGLSSADQRADRFFLKNFGVFFWKLFRARERESSTARDRVGYDNYPLFNKEVVDKNLYPYPWVEIHTYIRTRRISGGYQVPVEFIISYIKITSK
jgi:hypothetical protein